MYIPKFLKKDDVIGVSAPSAGFTEQVDITRLESAKFNLSERGYEVIETDNVRKCEKGRSSTGKKRAEEFISLIKNEKVKIYKRALALKNLDELKNLYSELEDRFGKIKSEAKGFFDFIKIRIIARELGITTIKQDKENKDRILINFDEKKINVDKIIYLLSNKKIMYSKFTRTIGYNGDIFEFFRMYKK